MNEATRLYNPDTLAKPVGYTHVTVPALGPLAFISGQIALDRQGNVVGAGDLRAQTIQVFENLRHALAAVGATFADVVKLTYFLTDMTQMPIVREVRGEYLDLAKPPASTAVGVTGLARPELMIEIEAIAVLPHGV
jgi:enamine deaminase RidA (YjgF/YER057c/UK114 family)